MMNHYIKFFLFFLFVAPLYPQEVTTKDYERAVSYLSDNLRNQRVFNLYTEANWFPKGNGLWFIDYSKNHKSFNQIDFKKFTIQPLFDHSKMAETLGSLSDKKVNEDDLPISNLKVLENNMLQVDFEDKTYIVDLSDYSSQSKKDKEQEESESEKKSPDGQWIAFSKDYNLFIRNSKTDEVFQLSTDGKANYEYASYYGWFDKMEGENGVRPTHFSVKWSKDSKWLETSIVDTRIAEKMFLLDYSIDSLYKPRLLSYYRGSPGDTSMVKVTPVIYNVETKQKIKTDLPTGTHINPVTIQWLPESGELLAQYNERGFKKSYVKHLDLDSGSETVVIEETSATNIDNFWFDLLEDAGKMVFLSERSGWRQLYLADLKTAQTKSITSGEFYINEVSHIDHKQEIIYFMASGVDASMNPYHQQLYKIDFKGKMELLTPEKTHHIIDFSEDGKYFIDNYSTVNIPTRTVLRDSKDGKILVELTTADVSKVESQGWESPEVFSLTAKDEKTKIYGAIWKPSNFDANKSYPLIDNTYTGPHTQLFPKSFDRALDNQSLAELGFIVMRVDGLGTSGRSKEFHDHSYKNMGNNLEDHVLAIKYLGANYPYIDTDRVGVFGHSAGGYDTGRAMLAFPEVYKVGVASSADHDFRMEKAWWPEMYQGWPVDETYEEVSNITNAKNLEGKLLLVHGGLDDNVNPSATFKLAEALIQADKEFDLLILPSQRHGYEGQSRKYFIKKRWNYFVKHLLNAEPIWNFNWE